ncbi:flagellar biosynthesis regulator FlaF [Psychromarinibacter halotolerans]|uniref:Flagellar biosynthesis regulator FlaF n=1 Tax=Psychromarinibacter halotolerans TaxID=1775175 RepID=A0ABV7GJJ4_9RHOB|nr:flagellar biosynthesis regulator FlaF [Psychromarinibacter halotolerans]MAQ86025.1 flaF protein [Maritimibacter sp.]MDF0595791.1 flagellar biosynthesis regulator FlaF [Psychromarinibacter halotolerans]
MSLDAYKKSLKTTETPRAMERRVLTQITSRLDAHQAEYDAAAEGPSRLGILAGPLRSAVHDNVRLWLGFKADLLTPGNALPAETRAGLLSLAGFVERQSGQIMNGRGTIESLIAVNKPIIAALQGHTVEAA